MNCSHCQAPIPDGSRFCLTCGSDLSEPGVSTRQRAAVRELHETLKAAVEGHYRVTDMLGRGGMGAVFLAEDLRLGRRVAIKVLLPELTDDGAVIGRFIREARIAAGLDHPNIIPIYAVEQVGDFHYFVMKHVTGRSLDEMLEGRSLPVEQALDILRQAADALAHAHAHGVVHRDVKPSNIMLDEHGRVLLMDFGISKALEAGTQYTSTGQMVGTPRYVSPEQALGEAIDGRSDQYSLGVVGYQMLVGRLPITGDSVHALMYKHVHEIPAAARSVRPEIPAAVSNALQRALAKKPDQRFASMDEFASALGIRADVDGTVRSGSVGLARAARSSLRTRWLAVGGGAVVALVAAAVGLNAYRGEPAPPSRDSVAAPVVKESPPPAVPAPPPDTHPPPPSVSARPEKARPVRDERPRSAPAPTRDTAAQSTGYLTVNAVPYGSVSIDGAQLGDTPLVRHQLAPGEHTVRIEREGYRTENVVVTITPRNEVRLSRSLVKEGQ
jgi:serine/threonine-protein kinase